MTGDGVERGISRDPGVRGGEPVFTGTRTPVARIAALLLAGSRAEEIQIEYDLSPEQIAVARQFSNDRGARS